VCVRVLIGLPYSAAGSHQGAARRNRAQQVRAQRSAEMRDRKRAEQQRPRVVVFVPLSQGAETGGAAKVVFEGRDPERPAAGVGR
jgi:hypothetical protein